MSIFETGSSVSPEQGGFRKMLRTRKKRFPRSLFPCALWACVFVTLASLLVLQSGTGVAAQQRVTFIRGGTLIDGNGGPPLQDAVIIIEGNRIRSVVQGPAGAPPGAQEIDARGKYIIPGLWDTHTHYHEWFPELQINNGVTSVLSYGGGPWLNAVREGTEKHKIY